MFLLESAALPAENDPCTSWPGPLSSCSGGVWEQVAEIVAIANIFGITGEKNHPRNFPELLSAVGETHHRITEQ